MEIDKAEALSEGIILGLAGIVPAIAIQPSTRAPLVWLVGSDMSFQEHTEARYPRSLTIKETFVETVRFTGLNNDRTFAKSIHEFLIASFGFVWDCSINPAGPEWTSPTKLRKQFVLVTGAASGIARAVAALFGLEGTGVMVADNNVFGGLQNS